MAKKSKTKKQAKVLTNPYLQLSEDEPSDGFLYLHAPRHMARHDAQMAEAFGVVATMSELGGRFVSAAKKKHVQFKRTGYDQPFKGGESFGNEVSLAVENSFDEDINIIPHELMHWRQPEMPMFTNWDLRSRLLATLVAESTAETAAIKATHEIRESGYRDAFDLKAKNKRWREYRTLYHTFDSTLQEGIKNCAALPELEASDAAVHCYFDQDELVWMYGLNVLEEYLVDIAEDPHFYPVTGFSLKVAKQLAKTGKKEFLVQDGVELPLSDKKLFKKNGILRQAFDYAEAAHILHLTGGDHSDLAFHRKWVAMEKEGNPFMQLNLYDIITAHSTSETPENVIATMLDLAEYEPEYAL